MNDAETDDLCECVIAATTHILAYSPWDSEDENIIPVDVKLVTMDGTVIGRALGDSVNSIRLAGDDLFEVCDADSAGLGWACDALFPRGSNELHSELNPEIDMVFKFLFLYQDAFLPCVTPEQRMIFVHLIADRFMDGEGVLITWNAVGDLTPAQLAHLGFKRIANTDFVFCFASRSSPFSAEFDLNKPGAGIHVRLPPNATADFEALWKSASDD